MLIVKSDIAERLCAHALNEYPKECCGIMLGKKVRGNKTVFKMLGTKNLASDKGHFLIDPLDVAKAEQEPLEILGFYHSHPDCEAIPSKEDVLHMIEGHSYLIISVYGSECSDIADIRSFERISQTSEKIIEETLKKEQ